MKTTGPLNLDGNELLNARAENLASKPAWTSAFIGRTIFVTTAGVDYGFWIGGTTNWESAESPSGPAGGALTGNYPDPGLADHATSHADGGSDELPVENLPTAEMAATKYLRADGAGGLAFDTPPSGGSPTGSAGGDLGGTYPDPDVVALQGYPVDVADPGAAPGPVMTWDSAKWTPQIPRISTSVNIPASTGGSAADVLDVDIEIKTPDGLPITFPIPIDIWISTTDGGAPGGTVTIFSFAGSGGGPAPVVIHTYVPLTSFHLRITAAGTGALLVHVQKMSPGTLYLQVQTPSSYNQGTLIWS